MRSEPNLITRRIRSSRWNKGGIWVRHSGEHARPSVKVSGVSRAKRSLLDSNQGLRVPIRDVHCAWVYREYDRGKSPSRDGPIEKPGIWLRSLSFVSLSFSLYETVTCHVWLWERFPYSKLQTHATYATSTGCAWSIQIYVCLLAGDTTKKNNDFLSQNKSMHKKMVHSKINYKVNQKLTCSLFIIINF